ncbi:hypothetical protein VTI74DRAFT_3340 [Chaetomium olivicolor]
MSHGHPLPAGLMGFGMPLSMGPDMPTLQMTADPGNTIPLLDSSLFFNFDGVMAMNLDPTHPLPQSYGAAPAQSSSTALVGRGGGQLAFSSGHTASNMSGTGSQPQEGTDSGSASNHGILTDFTKRPNWPAKVVEELQDLLQIVDREYRIKHMSPNSVQLTGYTLAELRGKTMDKYLHPDDVGLFVSEFNECIASNTPMRIFYRLKKKDGNYAVFETVGHAHIAGPKFAVEQMENTAPFCQAVFMMSRPYPTKNSALLDSFLEHKIENERLKRKIAELKKEEEDEAEESERLWQQQSQETTPSDGGLRGMAPTFPHATADLSTLARERHASLDIGAAAEGLAGTQPPSAMGDATATATSTRADTIEMLTGLRYQEGERSMGITTGNPSPALITGDAGIAIPVDRDTRTGEKKKKLKVAEEYVCTDCGTLESPEWRKGPSGPKTLCNACGLRWAKKEKKKSASSSGAEHHQTGDATG